MVKVQSQVFIPFSMFSLFQTGGSCKAYTLFFDFLFLNVNDARLPEASCFDDGWDISSIFSIELAGMERR